MNKQEAIKRLTDFLGDSDNFNVQEFLSDIVMDVDQDGLTTKVRSIWIEELKLVVSVVKVIEKEPIDLFNNIIVSESDTAPNDALVLVRYKHYAALRKNNKACIRLEGNSIVIEQKERIYAVSSNYSISVQDTWTIKKCIIDLEKPNITFSSSAGWAEEWTQLSDVSALSVNSRELFYLFWKNLKELEKNSKACFWTIDQMGLWEYYDHSFTYDSNHFRKLHDFLCIVQAYMVTRSVSIMYRGKELSKRFIDYITTTRSSIKGNINCAIDFLKDGQKPHEVIGIDNRWVLAIDFYNPHMPFHLAQHLNQLLTWIDKYLPLRNKEDATKMITIVSSFTEYELIESCGSLLWLINKGFTLDELYNYHCDLSHVCGGRTPNSILLLHRQVLRHYYLEGDIRKSFSVQYKKIDAHHKQKLDSLTIHDGVKVPFILNNPRIETLCGTFGNIRISAPDEAESSVQHGYGHHCFSKGYECVALHFENKGKVLKKPEHLYIVGNAVLLRKTLHHKYQSDINRWMKENDLFSEPAQIGVYF